MLRFTQDILLALRAISNEEEAHEMSKKAREQFDFLGIRLVPRREVTYPIFDKYPPKDGDDAKAEPSAAINWTPLRRAFKSGAEKRNG